MGSILAETVESEHIDKLVAPVKDLFGAIFFVSVGMMVDPNMIVEYIWPILAIVVSILLGQTIFGTGGVCCQGQPLKIAMQCGFSLTQIGEFAFIIAALGSKSECDELFPISDCGGCIRDNDLPTHLYDSFVRSCHGWVDRHLPVFWKHLLERYSVGAACKSSGTTGKTVGSDCAYHIDLSGTFIAMVVLSFNLFLPLLISALGGFGEKCWEQW